MFHRGLLIVVLAVCAPAFAVDVVVLTAETYEDYAPEGKETDAIYGDIALRNDHVLAVIAQAGEHRNANMMTRGIGGGLIDFTTRSGQSDLLGVFLPWMPYATVVLNGIEIDGKMYTAQESYEPVMRGATVTIQFTVIASMAEVWGSNKAPRTVVRYTLSDGDKTLKVHSSYFNTGDEAIDFQIRQYFRMDRAKDARAITKASDGARENFWSYDQWFDQAYVVAPESGQYRVQNEAGGLAPSYIVYLDGESGARQLAPGRQVELTQYVACGPTLSHALASQRAVAEKDQFLTTLHVTDSSGAAIENAMVEFMQHGETCGWGRTDARGIFDPELPAADYNFRVTSDAHGSQDIAIKVPAEDRAKATFDVAGAVEARITDELGGPIPAKVQFTGVDDTITPFFGPDSGSTAVHNVRYTHDGRFRQELAEGAYDVIVSYGPEYDAEYAQITIEKGNVVPMNATLRRVVDTTGWISSDLHSHSTPSGDNVSSQRGRVLNLLCEHIEFAPCTEHNRLDSYKPHLRALGIEDLMATCTGMELTSSPGGLNHHNVFPLLPRYGEQDNGAPRPALYPEVQIARLAYWDGESDKLIQQNHPDMPAMFFDRNGDKEKDEGFDGMFEYMDVIEIHPHQAIFYAPLTGEPAPAYLERSLNRNRMATWLQLWNLGMGVPGVVNTDAHANFHGSGWLRNYIGAQPDDLTQVDVQWIVKACEKGTLVMSNGPFLEMSVSSGMVESSKSIGVGVGGNLSAPSGEVRVNLRIQCANWYDIDRVDILVNGQRRDDLIFTREKNPEMFTDDVVRFEHSIPIKLESDANIIAATIGMNSGLGDVMGPQKGVFQPCAVTNPIFVDIDGDKVCTPNGDDLGIPLIP